MIGIGYKKLLKKVYKTIVIFFIIFIIFPVFSNKINPQKQVKNLAKPFSVSLNSSAFPGSLFAQTSEQIDPFHQKLFEEGKYFYDNGNYTEAIENFEIAFIGLLDNESKLLECYIYLTVCFYQIKNLEKSKFFYNEIKRLNLQEYMKTIKPPKSLLDKYHEIASYFSRFEAQAKISSPDSSKKTADLPTITSPSSKEILEAEIKRLKEAIKNDKRNLEAYFRLSTIYLEQGKNKKAKSVLKDLIKLDEKNGNAYFELGKIFVTEKKYYEALNQYRRAALLLQGDIELHYEIAKIYYELKNYQRAKQEFLKVQEINKTYKDTEKYLALIEEKEKRK